MALPAPWKPTEPPTIFDSGQAQVFRVRRPGRSGDFALKRLKNRVREHRFDREIEAMRDLVSQGVTVIPPVVEAGRDDQDRPYYVMPWYEGGSAAELLERGGFHEDMPAGVDFLKAVAEAVAAVHAAGWAHRDVKPENILLDDGRPLLADLGLTMAVEAAGDPRLTAAAEAVGSRLYIAPENASGINQEQDQRPADFYAFGKLMWALLAGRRPPAREEQLEPSLRLESLLGRGVCAPLDALGEQLLRTDPRARLQEWDPVISELGYVRERLTGDPPPAADAPSARERARHAATRYASTADAQASRLGRERDERQNAAYGEIRGAISRGVHEYQSDFEDLTTASGRTINLAVSQGHPQLSQVLQALSVDSLGVAINVDTALRACVGDGAFMIAMHAVHEPLPPSLQLAAYVYVDAAADTAWILRIPVIIAFPEAALHFVDTLRQRYGATYGPFHLALSSTVDRAGEVGDALGRDGLELAAEYLDHLASGRDLLNELTWSAPPS